MFCQNILHVLLLRDHWCIAISFNMIEDPIDCVGNSLVTTHGHELTVWEQLVFSLQLVSVWHVASMVCTESSLLFHNQIDVVMVLRKSPKILDTDLQKGSICFINKKSHIVLLWDLYNSYKNVIHVVLQHKNGSIKSEPHGMWALAMHYSSTLLLAYIFSTSVVWHKCVLWR